MTEKLNYKKPDATLARFNDSASPSGIFASSEVIGGSFQYVFQFGAK